MTFLCFFSFSMQSLMVFGANSPEWVSVERFNEQKEEYEDKLRSMFNQQQQKYEDKLHSMKHDWDMEVGSLAIDYENIAEKLTQKYNDELKELQNLIDQLRDQVLKKDLDIDRLNKLVLDYQHACQRFKHEISKLQKEKENFTQENYRLQQELSTLQVSSASSDSFARASFIPEPLAVQAPASVVKAVDSKPNTSKPKVPDASAAFQTTNILTAKPRKKGIGMFSIGEVLNAGGTSQQSKTA